MFMHKYTKEEAAVGFLKNKRIQGRPVNLIENSIVFFQQAYEQNKKIITIVTDITRYGPYQDRTDESSYESRKVNRYEFRLSVALLNLTETPPHRDNHFYWKLGIRGEFYNQLPNPYVDAYAPCLDFEYPTLVQPMSTQPLTNMYGRQVRYSNLSSRLKINRRFGEDYSFGIHTAFPIDSFKWIPIIEVGAEAVLDQFFPERHNGIYL